MKIVSYTKIKNESDIIETFVRYHLNIFDEMYFVENGSFDGTLEILLSLRDEGLPVHIIDERNSVFDRLKFASYYMFVVYSLSLADWIVPLDADEFLAAEDGIEPRDVLQKKETDVIYKVSWRTYICNKGEESNDIFEFGKFGSYWSEKVQKPNKVIIPGACIKNKEFFLMEGQHDIVSNDAEMTVDVLPAIFLAHFPVRSNNQIKKLAYVNYFSLMQQNNTVGFSRHWIEMYKDIYGDHIDLLEMSKHYIKTIGFNNVRENGFFEMPFSRIENKYDGKAIMSTEKILALYSEIITMRYVLSQTQIRYKHMKTDNRIKLLVYGIGNKFRRRYRDIDDKRFNVVACVDTDILKHYIVVNERLVIPPAQMENLEWDICVVMPDDYSEIIRNLKEKFSNKIIIHINDFIIYQYKIDLFNYKEL